MLASYAGLVHTEKISGMIGRLGLLDRTYSVKEYSEYIKNKLNSKSVRYLDCGIMVNKLAVIGGAGGDYLDMCKENGADTLLTGELKYHEFLAAKTLGLNIIEAGHFATENIIIKYLENKLSAKFPSANFIISDLNRDILESV